MNLLAILFGAYTLNGSSELNPHDDFSNAPPGTIRHSGDYIYYVAFGRGSIQLLLITLLSTTVLMWIGALVCNSRGPSSGPALNG